MAVREEYTYESKDDVKTTIHAIKWTPYDGHIKGVLQVCHGMQEYTDRYQEFAEYMTANGFAVVGNDDIGHGLSVPDESELGVMHTSDPARTIISDILHNYKVTREQYPNVPYFFMGHSMGSYLLRMMLSEHAAELSDLSGALIIGTGTEKDSSLRFGMALANVIGWLRGWDYKSKAVSNLMYTKPYKKFSLDGSEPSNSWLSRNIASVEKYYSDPKCNYLFSVNGYRVLLSACLYDNQISNIKKINKDLPVYFASGSDDPVGRMGEGTTIAYERFKEAGIKDVTLKLYPDDRHEILNELDRGSVYDDIMAWIRLHMPE